MSGSHKISEIITAAIQLEIKHAFVVEFLKDTNPQNSYDYYFFFFLKVQLTRHKHHLNQVFPSMVIYFLKDARVRFHATPSGATENVTQLFHIRSKTACQNPNFTFRADTQRIRPLGSE